MPNYAPRRRSVLSQHRSAWIANILIAVILLPPTALSQTIGVDYTKLSTKQQSLFQSFAACSPVTCPLAWQGLTSSEQLEFAGGTQGLSTVQLQIQPETGLDTIDSVLKIHGSEPSQPSAKQFNIETKWKAGAADQFKGLDSWSDHIAIFHPGQYGYQQNEDGNPFLGLVVLFDDAPGSQKGQFHIDFRSWFAHFCPDNGNVAANYDEYVGWYGSIAGYSPLFKFVFPELTRNHFSAQAQVPNVPEIQGSSCSGDIQETVQRFLSTWYIDKNFGSLLGFVARDNVYNAANLETLGLKSSSALWLRLFSDAFESSSNRISKLEGALEYHKPAFRDPARNLQYANSEAVNSGAALYGIIDPGSVPDGAVFPRSAATDLQRAHWDVQAKYLEHLRQDYRMKLYVVIYATVGPGLVRETVVQYWIKEGNCWRLSALQGTNW